MKIHQIPQKTFMTFRNKKLSFTIVKKFNKNTLRVARRRGGAGLRLLRLLPLRHHALLVVAEEPHGVLRDVVDPERGAAPRGDAAAIFAKISPPRPTGLRDFVDPAGGGGGLSSRRLGGTLVRRRCYFTLSFRFSSATNRMRIVRLWSGAEIREDPSITSYLGPSKDLKAAILDFSLTFVFL